MWIPRAYSSRNHCTQYLAYGLAYYLLAVFCLMNLSHRTAPSNMRSRIISTESAIPTRVKSRSQVGRLGVYTPGLDWLRLYTYSDVHTNDSDTAAERRFYSLRSSRVNTFPYDAVIRPDVVCTANTHTIIVVHSHHPNFKKRTAIRETWGAVAANPGARTEPALWPYGGRVFGKKIRLLFILGIHKDPGLNDQLWEESLTHGDIVQGNFLDSYRNMTLKSLLGLKVILDFCPKAKYLLKCDDDMFLNMPHFIDTLSNRPMQRSILGPLSIHARVYRSGKWKLTKEEFPFDIFPPYESGAAYVITSDLWRDILMASYHVPLIHIDDVYITGILGKILNVSHVKLPGFAFWNSKIPAVCDIITNQIFSATNMTPDLLRKTWKDLGIKQNCKKNP